MDFRKFVVGGAAFAALLFLSGCDEALKEETKKISVEFSEPAISIPAGNTAETLVKVEPAARASEVTIEVAAESVVSIGNKEITDEGILLTLVSHSISSTTVYAIHPDLEQTPECEVTVTPIPLTGISLDKKEITLNVRETTTLSPVLTPADVTSPTLLWKSDDETVATVEGGVVTGVKEGKTKVTVSSGEFSASCDVTVNAISVESLELVMDNVSLTDGETVSFFVGEKIKINAKILPENATYRKVTKWILRDMDPVDTLSFYVSGADNGIYVTGKKEGRTSITARIDVPGVDSPIIKGVELRILPKAVPTTDPKIGDYFYSDGTWSDGGFLGYEKVDGVSYPLWNPTKPEPTAGKKVIGIVFSTDPTRISETERNLGFTHGLVLCTKAAHAPVTDDPEADHKLDYWTKFTFEESFESSQALMYIDYGVNASSYYSDIEGYDATHGMFNEYYDPTAEKSPSEQYPAIDWVMRGFEPAPAETSDWYVPSSGQLWDFFANLGGDEIRLFLDEYKEQKIDLSFEYKSFLHINNDPMAILNYHWSKVPDSMKELPRGGVRNETRVGLDKKYFTYSSMVYQFLTCSLYDFEHIRMFWFATSLNSYVNKEGQTDKFGGDFLPYLESINLEMSCYPVLSF